MILQIFSVRDSKSEAFAPPFFYPAIPLAVRAFGDALDDVTHPISKHPEDFSLFVCGEFDDATGKITSDDEPRLIQTGLQAKEARKNGKR